MAPTARSSARLGRTGPRRTLVMWLAVVVAVFMVVGWIVVSARVSAQLKLSWAAESPTCTGASIKGPNADGLGPDGDARRVTLQVDPRLRCSFEIRAANQSGHALHLGSVAFSQPLLRSAPIRVQSIAGSTPRADEAEDTVETDLDQALAPGATRSFKVRVVYDTASSVGCGAGRDSTTEFNLHGFVTVHTRVLGIRHTEQDDNTLRLVRRGEANCD